MMYMSEEFDLADYSFVVKRRGNPQKPWRWEIYCAGKSVPVERSPVFFESMAEEAKVGPLPSQTGGLRSPHPAFGLGSSSLQPIK
jgi:hypothetical protein